jgi:hypothetical protein
LILSTNLRPSELYLFGRVKRSEAQNGFYSLNTLFGVL